MVFWGTSDNNGKNGNKGHRWNWGKYTTTLIHDFEDVLAALIALKNNKNDAFIDQCRIAESNNSEKPHTPQTDQSL